MRGLVKAGLLFAPVFASAIDVNTDLSDVHDVKDTPVIHVSTGSDGGSIINFPAGSKSEYASAQINVLSNDYPSHDDEFLKFDVEVLPFEEICGYGNVVVNGDTLGQESKDARKSFGKGPIASNVEGPVIASWEFECLTVGDDQVGQLLKFDVNEIGGKPVKDIGFAFSFKQTETTEIIRIRSGVSQEGATNWLESGKDVHVHEEFLDVEEPVGFPEFDFEERVQEIESLKAEVAHLMDVIAQKERDLEQYRFVDEDKQVADEIKKCDSLKCIMRLTLDKARGAAGIVYGKISGFEDFDGERPPPPPPPHGKPPHGKPPHGEPVHGPKNGSCHGNSTQPPPPRFGKPGKPGKPHGRPDKHQGPPPPPHHGDHEHNGPPPHGDHKHHGPPPPPPPPHHGPHGDHDHHGPPPPPPPDFEGGEFPPHHGSGHHHGPPPPFDEEEDFRGPPHHHHGPPPAVHEDRPHREHGPRPGRPERPSHEHQRPPPKDKQGPPRPDREDTPHKPHGATPPSKVGEDKPEHRFPSERPDSNPSPMEEEPGRHAADDTHLPPKPLIEHLWKAVTSDGSPPPPPPNDDGHPPPKPLIEKILKAYASGGDTAPPPPPMDDGPGRHEDGPDGHGGPPPPRRRHLHRFLNVLKFIVGGFMFSILLLTLHRRHIRNARRANRRPNALCRFISARFGLTGPGYGGFGDEDEKSGLIMNQEEIIEEEEMDSEIQQFRNATDVVSDIVAAEEGRFVPSSASSSSQTVESELPEEAQQAQQQYARMDSLPGYRGGMSMNMTGIEGDADEIELPAYEDNDGSEAASVVQDGFRYGGPGSMYTPSSGSETSSLHEVLGATKN